MKPGSTDGVLTLLASFLVAALLFAGRMMIEGRGDGGFLSESTQTTTEPPRNEEGGTTASRPSSDWIEESHEDFTQPPQFPSETTTASRPREPGTAAGPATNETFKVVRVVDGDTIDVLVNRSPLRLRLNGVDTPEKGQPFGNNATEDLSQLIGGKHVRYVVRNSDGYGRSIADIYLNDLHVNLWLVRRGLAWHYVAYSDDASLAAAEAEAKAAGRGVWSDPRRVAPWNWRKLSHLQREEFQ